VYVGVPKTAGRWDSPIETGVISDSLETRFSTTYVTVPNLVILYI